MDHPVPEPPTTAWLRLTQQALAALPAKSLAAGRQRARQRMAAGIAAAAAADSVFASELTCPALAAATPLARVSFAFLAQMGAEPLGVVVTVQTAAQAQAEACNELAHDLALATHPQALTFRWDALPNKKGEPLACRLRAEYPDELAAFECKQTAWYEALLQAAVVPRPPAAVHARWGRGHLHLAVTVPWPALTPSGVRGLHRELVAGLTAA